MDKDTSCPSCGSDDYECLEWDQVTGLPDYDGEKQCQECQETWA